MNSPFCWRCSEDTALINDWFHHAPLLYLLASLSPNPSIFLLIIPFWLFKVFIWIIFLHTLLLFPQMTLSGPVVPSQCCAVCLWPPWVCDLWVPLSLFVMNSSLIIFLSYISIIALLQRACQNTQTNSFAILLFRDLSVSLPFSSPSSSSTPPCSSVSPSRLFFFENITLNSIFPKHKMRILALILVSINTRF